MKFHLSFSNPLCHFLDIHAVFTKDVDMLSTTLKLPGWRPGRYQMMHFSKYIQRVRIEGSEGKALDFKKTGLETWQVNSKGENEIHVYYKYFANQMDGGGSWLDEEQVYVNPINCLLYDEHAMNESCEIELDLPDHCTIGSALNFKNNVALANNYFELVDKPIMASLTLREYEFTVDDTPFKLWIQGSGDFDWDKTLKDLGAVAIHFQKIFEGFPFPEYHFLTHFLPYQHYHGVEHKDSTVIILGPTEEINSGDLYSKFLGVCSHELFHAWNVCLIRPKELLPYDFSTPAFFETGYVAEGFTTYYGDISLVRSGVIKTEEYLEKLNLILTRHFDNGGRFNSSLAESSLNLWLNGYDESAPNSKVSIYVKGAIVALMLDLDLIVRSEGKTSLNDLMRYLWKEFGKNQKGYVTTDILTGLKNITGRSYKKFFDQCIYGCEPVEKLLSELLDKVGCTLDKILPSNAMEKKFGFRCREDNDRILVNQIVPLSPAYGNLCIYDELKTVDGRIIKSIAPGGQLAKNVELSVMRGGKEVTVNLESGQVLFFSNFRMQLKEKRTQKEEQLFKTWLSAL